MYPASDGKIYIASQSAVVDLHYINYPDSGGLACDVHLHSLHIPCYNWGTVPNHPNYFLGEMLGSPCDTLSIGINEITNNKKTLLIYPNPANENVTVVYATERNDNCKLEIMDMQGKVIQHIHLPCNQNQFTFYTGSILPGLYIVKLLDGDKLAAQSKLGIAR